MDVFWLLLVYTIVVSTISLHFLLVSLHADCNTFECCTLCSEGKLGQLLDAESFHTILSMVETDLFPYAPAFPRSAISVRLPCRVVRVFFFFLSIAHLILPPSFWPFVSHGHIDFLFSDFFLVAFCSLWLCRHPQYTSLHLPFSNGIVAFKKTEFPCRSSQRLT